SHAVAVRIATTTSRAARTDLGVETLMCVVHVGKATVGICIVEFHSSRSFQDHTLGNLKFFVLHAIGHAHDNLLLVVCCRDCERSHLGFKKAWNTDSRPSLFLVKFPRNWGELRLV